MGVLRSQYLNTFYRACSSRAVDPKDVLTSLSINPDHFIRTLESNEGPSVPELRAICGYFEITPEAFITGFIDQAWISSRNLPSRYKFSAGSKFRTSLAVLDYVKQRGGDEFLQHILRTLKIPSELLSCPDEKVSINLLSDILNLLSQRGFQKNDFLKMGWHSAAIQENAIIGKDFIGLSQKEVFEKLFNETILRYEENFNYEIVRSSNESIQVRTSAKDCRIEDFCDSKIDNIHVAFYRQGACGAHLKFAGYPIAKSELISSKHLGGSSDEFRLSWVG